MAKRKAKRVKKTKKKASPRKKARSPRKTKKKTVKRSVVKKRVRRKPARKVTRPAKTTEQIANKYFQETKTGFSKPKTISEFDKELEETAKLLARPELTNQHALSQTDHPLMDDRPVQKEPEPHHTMMSEAHHEKHFAHVHHHDRVAIWALVCAIVGVLIPLVSIVGIILGAVAVKKGSHTGKGTILLAVFTLILNLVLIYIFMNMYVI